MICPILLNQLSLNAKKGWTVFILTLSMNDCDYATVRKALQEIYPEMLLFTRRLRQIEISVVPGATGPPQEDLYNITSSMFNGFPACTIHSRSSGKNNLGYFRQEWVVSDMPDHPKRQDSKDSEIVLAFPFNHNGPVIGEQQIFAFMPLYRTPLPVQCHLSPD